MNFMKKLLCLRDHGLADSKGLPIHIEKPEQIILISLASGTVHHISQYLNGWVIINDTTGRCILFYDVADMTEAIRQWVKADEDNRLIIYNETSKGS
jgi:hypothetical protein